MSLLHVSGEVGDLLAKIGEVEVLNRSVEEGEPAGDGDCAVAEGGAEGEAVDEDGDFALGSVERQSFECGGEVGGDALEGGVDGGREGIQRWRGAGKVGE